MYTSPLPDPAATIAPGRPRRTTIVLAVAALLVLLVTTAADGTQHGKTSPEPSAPTAAEEHAEPCGTEEQTEVLGRALGSRDLSDIAGVVLVVRGEATPDAIFPCLHPHLNCAL